MSRLEADLATSAMQCARLESEIQAMSTHACTQVNNVHMHIPMYAPMHVPMHVPTRVPMHLSIHVAIHVPVHTSIRTSASLIARGRWQL